MNKEFSDRVSVQFNGKEVTGSRGYDFCVVYGYIKDIDSIMYNMEPFLVHQEKVPDVENCKKYKITMERLPND